MTDIADIPNLAPAAQTVSNVTLVQPHADNATVGTAIESINNTNADMVIPVILGADIDVVSADAGSNIPEHSPTERGLKTVHIIVLDNEGDEYRLTQISAGVSRYTDAIALLDIAKSENKREMGF